MQPIKSHQVLGDDHICNDKKKKSHQVFVEIF